MACITTRTEINENKGKWQVLLDVSEVKGQTSWHLSLAGSSSALDQQEKSSRDVDQGEENALDSFLGSV